MKINYQETTSDLQTRIDIHNQFGGRNIDQWMLETLQLKTGAKILDVGCGSGKQCFSYHHHLKGQADITGGDVNHDMVLEARRQAQTQGVPIQFIDLDFNQTFPCEENTYDLVSCCFAIYYSEDIPFTIREMHRALKSGGRLFTTGPMPENKQLFYDLIREATQKTIPPMPGSSRYASAILSTIRGLFSSVEVHIFENPLTFQTVEPLIAYTRASLTEDRKLWVGLFNGKEEYEDTIQKITQAAERRLARDGQLVMTKVVGGFVATK